MTLLAEKTETSGTVGAMAGFVAGLSADELPARVVSLAKRQIVGLLAAAYAGQRTSDVRRVVEAVLPAPDATAPSRGLAGLKATALPLRGAAPLEDALYLNACASMAHDMDDYLLFGHTGHSAVFAALGAAEATGATGAHALAAIVAANELSARLGGAISIGPQNGQLWSPIHALGGAAATARVLGLDRAQTGHALGIALYQPPFGLWPGFLGPGSKVLTAAEPLRQGARAAFLAKAGLTGPLDVLDGPKGLLARIPFLPLAGLLGGLGQAWLTETLSFKTTPGCAYVSSAVKAASEAHAALRAHKHGELDAEAVERVTVEASVLTVLMDRLSRPHVAEVALGKRALTPVLVNFSTPLSLALLLLDDGALTPASLEDERLRRDRDAILRIASRVQVKHDLERTRALFRELDRVFDLAALTHGVTLAELARATRALRSLHEGGGLLEGVEDVLNLAGSGAGREVLHRVLGKRLGASVEWAWHALLHKIDERIPGGDQDPHHGENGHAYDLGRRPVGGFRALFGAGVALRTRDGVEAHAACEIPPGASGRDEDEQERLVREKLERHATPVIGPRAVERILEIVGGLEAEKDLSALGRALRGA